MSLLLVVVVSLTGSSKLGCVSLVVLNLVDWLDIERKFLHKQCERQGQVEVCSALALPIYLQIVTQPVLQSDTVYSIALSIAVTPPPQEKGLVSESYVS